METDILAAEIKNKCQMLGICPRNEFEDIAREVIEDRTQQRLKVEDDVKLWERDSKQQAAIFGVTGEEPSCKVKSVKCNSALMKGEDHGALEIMKMKEQAKARQKIKMEEIVAQLEMKIKFLPIIERKDEVSPHLETKDKVAPVLKNINEISPELEMNDGSVSSKEPGGGIKLKEPSGGVSPKESSGDVSPNESSDGVSPKESSGGVSSKEPGGGVSSKEPGGGVRSKKAGGGVSSKDPGGGVKLKEPRGGVKVKEPNSGVSPIKSGVGVKQLQWAICQLVVTLWWHTYNVSFRMTRKNWYIGFKLLDWTKILVGLLNLILAQGVECRVMMVPKSSVVQPGDTVTFNCTTTLIANPVTLLRIIPPAALEEDIYDNGLMQESRGTRFSVHRGSSSGQYVLTITDVAMEDAGEYLCRDDHGNGVESHTELSVYYIMPPELEVSPGSMLCQAFQYRGKAYLSGGWILKKRNMESATFNSTMENRDTLVDQNQQVESCFNSTDHQEADIGFVVHEVGGLNWKSDAYWIYKPTEATVAPRIGGRSSDKMIRSDDSDNNETTTRPWEKTSFIMVCAVTVPCVIFLVVGLVVICLFVIGKGWYKEKSICWQMSQQNRRPKSDEEPHGIKNNHGCSNFNRPPATRILLISETIDGTD